MDETKARIKQFVLGIAPSLDDSEGESGGEESGAFSLLDFTIDSVIDRTLIYTNRLQLVLEDDDYTDVPERQLPIPRALERVLAQVVVGAYNNTVNATTDKENAVKSISDNGQTVSYSEALANYLNSASESEIFSGSIALLNKFRKGNVHAYTREL